MLALCRSITRKARMVQATMGQLSYCSATCRQNRAPKTPAAAGTRTSPATMLPRLT